MRREPSCRWRHRGSPAGRHRDPAVVCSNRAMNEAPRPSSDREPVRTPARSAARAPHSGPQYIVERHRTSATMIWSWPPLRGSGLPAPLRHRRRARPALVCDARSSRHIFRIPQQQDAAASNRPTICISCVWRRRTGCASSVAAADADQDRLAALLLGSPAAARPMTTRCRRQHEVDQRTTCSNRSAYRAREIRTWVAPLCGLGMDPFAPIGVAATERKSATTQIPPSSMQGHSNCSSPNRSLWLHRDPPGIYGCKAR